jgi:hypothetical protein
MLKVNKVLFDLSTVYSNLSQSETWMMANTLTKAKEGLEDFLVEIEDRKLFDAHYQTEKNAIETQLFYVNANIRTLQDALLCHETKFIEKRLTLGDLGVFCLN